MKCPHCLESFHAHPATTKLGADADGYWSVRYTLCPSCHRYTHELLCASTVQVGGEYRPGPVKATYRVWPKASSRGPVSTEVTPELAEAYTEAALILPDSPQASAAISRRCLQQLLREKAGVKPQDLSKEIDEVLGSRTLPTHLAEAIDAVRAVGNFAAHPLKSQHTGEIMAVEAGEAEWTLDVLDGLFDFYFVQPAFLQKRRDALNAKLAEAGKPKLKESKP